VLNLTQHITRKRHGKSRYAVIGVGMALVLATSQSVMAQDNAQNNEKVQQASDGLNLNLGNTINPEFASSFTGQGNIIDLPSTSVGSTLFKLDISDPNCLAGVGQCLRRDDRVNLGLSTQFTSVSEKGLDVSLKPRASMKFDDENSSALVGAVVEIGEDLREGSEFKSNTWYVFAGADAEALTYSPNSINRLTSGQFHLQDRIIVGDAQAGVGYRIGDADVSLSYMRREAQAEDFSFTEDAAALSFTWKR
jgi:hypothetical protein